MKGVLVRAAESEASTGLALLIVPSLVGQWLVGAELAGVGITMARVTGIALIALSVALRVILSVLLIRSFVSDRSVNLSSK